MRFLAAEECSLCEKSQVRQHFLFSFPNVLGVISLIWLLDQWNFGCRGWFWNLWSVCFLLVSISSGSQQWCLFTGDSKLSIDMQHVHVCATGLLYGFFFLCCYWRPLNTHSQSANQLCAFQWAAGAIYTSPMPQPADTQKEVLFQHSFRYLTMGHAPCACPQKQFSIMPVLTGWQMWRPSPRGVAASSNKDGASHQHFSLKPLLAPRNSSLGTS